MVHIHVCSVRSARLWPGIRRTCWLSHSLGPSFSVSLPLSPLSLSPQCFFFEKKYNPKLKQGVSPFRDRVYLRFFWMSYCVLVALVVGRVLDVLSFPVEDAFRWSSDIIWRLRIRLTLILSRLNWYWICVYLSVSYCPLWVFVCTKNKKRWDPRVKNVTLNLWWEENPIKH